MIGDEEGWLLKEEFFGYGIKVILMVCDVYVDYMVWFLVDLGLKVVGGWFVFN